MLFILLLNPAIIALSVGLGLLVCRIFGANPHAGELFIAAGVCLISVEVAVLPLARRRNGKPDALFQAGFLGTVLHLLLAAALAGVVLFGFNTSNAFAYWMLALYWMSLMGLCWVIARQMRGSDAGANSNANADPILVIAGSAK